VFGHALIESTRDQLPTPLGQVFVAHLSRRERCSATRNLAGPGDDLVGEIFNHDRHVAAAGQDVPASRFGESGDGDEAYWNSRAARVSRRGKKRKPRPAPVPPVFPTPRPRYWHRRANEADGGKKSTDTDDALVHGRPSDRANRPAFARRIAAQGTRIMKRCRANCGPRSPSKPRAAGRHGRTREERPAPVAAE